MEFDNEGNFIQAWGGESGPGYQWPSNEHSITVDYKNFVWILGNADGKRNNPANLPNDNQVLKFTREGKFLMAIGKSGQTGSNATKYSKERRASASTPRQTKCSSATGMGTSRVWCMTRTRGSSSAMWGAYGNKPLDMDQRPPVEPSKPNELCPMVCGIWSTYQQFSLPHDIKFRTMARVCGRPRNKRVQVFNPRANSSQSSSSAWTASFHLQRGLLPSHQTQPNDFCTSQGPRTSTY